MHGRTHAWAGVQMHGRTDAWAGVRMHGLGYRCMGWGTDAWAGVHFKVHTIHCMQCPNFRLILTLTHRNT